MPTLFGRNYHEIQSVGNANRTMRVLLDLRNTAGLSAQDITDIIVLGQFLKDYSATVVGLSVLACGPTPSCISGMPLGFAGIIDESSSLDRTLQLAFGVHADIVISDICAKLLTEKGSTATDPRRQGLRVCTVAEGRQQLELFASGHDMPYAFRVPYWYLPWGVFYAATSEFLQGLDRNYTEKLAGLGEQSRARELFRSLVFNRLSDIYYARDKVLFYVQQRLYAKRKGWKRQQFSSEISFYLTTIVLMLWGGLDQMCLLVRDLLDLKVIDRSGPPPV